MPTINNNKMIRLVVKTSPIEGNNDRGNGDDESQTCCLVDTSNGSLDYVLKQLTTQLFFLDGEEEYHHHDDEIAVVRQLSLCIYKEGHFIGTSKIKHVSELKQDDIVVAKYSSNIVANGTTTTRTTGATTGEAARPAVTTTTDAAPSNQREEPHEEELVEEEGEDEQPQDQEQRQPSSITNGNGVGGSSNSRDDDNAVISPDVCASGSMKVGGIRIKQEDDIDDTTTNNNSNETETPAASVPVKPEEVAQENEDNDVIITGTHADSTTPVSSPPSARYAARTIPARVAERKQNTKSRSGTIIPTAPEAASLPPGSSNTNSQDEEVSAVTSNIHRRHHPKYKVGTKVYKYFESNGTTFETGWYHGEIETIDNGLYLIRYEDDDSETFFFHDDEMDEIVKNYQVYEENTGLAPKKKRKKCSSTATNNFKKKKSKYTRISMTASLTDEQRSLLDGKVMDWDNFETYMTKEGLGENTAQLHVSTAKNLFQGKGIQYFRWKKAFHP